MNTSDHTAHAPEDGVSMRVFAFEAIGTRWESEAYEPLSPRLRRRILERIRRFDATYSRFRPDSLVSRVAAAPDGGSFDFPGDSVALFDLYGRLHEATGGAVDPLVGRDLELLGYDRTYSLTPASDLVRAEARTSESVRAAWGRPRHKAPGAARPARDLQAVGAKRRGPATRGPSAPRDEKVLAASYRLAVLR